MKPFLIATSNRGKLREVRAMLAGLQVNVLSPEDVGGIAEPVEDGRTFEANARKKALHYARASGLLTLADDSGLEVDALGGLPGVYSARYAGSRASDAENNARLIRELRGIPAKRRTARFRCAMALAVPDAIVATGEGTVEGVIVDEPSGGNGFGYDPHFFIPELGVTAAELTPEGKNRISHRARALARIRPHIETHLGL